MYFSESPLLLDGAEKVIDAEVGEMFDYAKPASLISYLSKILTQDDDIILDFFAGSGTTAEAVMRLNAEAKDNNQLNEIVQTITQIVEKIKM